MILGKVQARDNTEGLQIIIDGEEEPTTKKYHYIASYVPSAGDRILIEEIGDSYVVIGKVIDNYANAGIARTASTANTAGSADEATKATKDASNNTITFPQKQIAMLFFFVMQIDKKRKQIITAHITPSQNNSNILAKLFDSLEKNSPTIVQAATTIIGTSTSYFT
jgi:hypothetical protein